MNSTLSKTHILSSPSTMADKEQSSISNDPIPRVIGFISSLLRRVSESNDLKVECGRSSAFHGVLRPTISIDRYLRRIFKYANCSCSCFVVAYVYLDRFVRRHPVLLIDSFSVHRLLITSVLVAVKFMDDVYFNNAYYAKVGGISTMEMNILEVDFLFALGFQLNVTPNTFHTYSSFLQTQMLFSEQPNLHIQTPLKLHSLNEDHESSLHKKISL